MKPFAVTVYVEADDAQQAVTHACDLLANEAAAHEMAALGDGIKVRPARRDEVKA